MRGLSYVAIFVAGCSFTPGTYTSGTDAPAQTADATGALDAGIDARPIDAPPDAFVPPSTTNHPSIADTFIASDFATSTGTSAPLFPDQQSALTDGDPARNALFRFDLTSIATTAAVSAAELHIWTYDDPGATVTFYPLLEAWDESTATWNQRSTGVAWSAAGAAPPSRGTTATATLTPSAAFTAYVVTIPAAVVAGWVANPASNHGLVLITTDTDGSRFSTKENTTASVRPYLRVTHTP